MPPRPDGVGEGGRSVMMFSNPHVGPFRIRATSSASSCSENKSPPLRQRRTDVCHCRLLGHQDDDRPVAAARSCSELRDWSVSPFRKPEPPDKDKDRKDMITILPTSRRSRRTHSVKKLFRPRRHAPPHLRALLLFLGLRFLTLLALLHWISTFVLACPLQLVSRISSFLASPLPLDLDHSIYGQCRVLDGGISDFHNLDATTSVIGSYPRSDSAKTDQYLSFCLGSARVCTNGAQKYLNQCVRSAQATRVTTFDFTVEIPAKHWGALKERWNMANYEWAARLAAVLSIPVEEIEVAVLWTPRATQTAAVSWTMYRGGVPERRKRRERRRLLLRDHGHGGGGAAPIVERSARKKETRSRNAVDGVARSDSEEEDEVHSVSEGRRLEPPSML